MKYILTFIATAALLQMLGYVDSAILAADYSITTVFFISLVVTALLFVATAIIPQPEPQDHAHH